MILTKYTTLNKNHYFTGSNYLTLYLAKSVSYLLRYLLVKGYTIEGFISMCVESLLLS